MCGHAMVGTVHERLDVIERQVNDLSLQIVNLAETQEALLQASVYLVEDRQRQTGPAGHAEGGGEPDTVGSTQALNEALAALQEEIRQLRRGRLWQ